MANQTTINNVRNRLRDAWEKATNNIRSRTERENERLRISEAKGAQLKRKIDRLVDEAIDIEAEERAEAIAESIVADLLEIIDELQGRVEDLEQRLQRLGSVGPTGTSTTL